MEIQHLMDNPLSSVNLESACQYSYRNFHAKGLQYVNLLRNDRLTAKLYIFKNVEHNSNGYIVWPHNHAYNFMHRTLVGEIINYKFALGAGGGWTMHTFDTPLNGGDGLKAVSEYGLVEVDRTLVAAGDSYYLDHKEIHTLRVHTSEYAAALLLQFHDVRSKTVMFAPVEETPDCEKDLYFRMQAFQARHMIEEFREYMNANKDGERNAEQDIIF